MTDHICRSNKNTHRLILKPNPAEYLMWSNREDSASLYDVLWLSIKRDKILTISIWPLHAAQ